jgi:hypothetical protein
MPLNRDQIVRALTGLDEKLRAQEIKGELCLVGGAVMLLAFNARVSTKDVDAILKPASLIRQLAKTVQTEEGLPDGWLNDAAKGYISAKHDAGIEEAKYLPRFTNLTVYSPTPEYLLAMKTMASRLPSVFDKGDVEDIRFLVRHLKLKSPAEVFSIVEKFYPPERVPTRAQYLIQTVFQEKDIRST